MNRKYLLDACEEIDAAVFTGDVLYDDVDRAALYRYIVRWSMAIATYEEQNNE